MGVARRIRMGLLALGFLGVVAGSRVAGASSALELVRIARAYEQARNEELALRRYMEALELDPTCEEAYLGLGSLRARRGDLREADRVYSVAISHRPDMRAAYRSRAYVRRALGLRELAAQDLLFGSEDDLAALRTLATWHGEDGQIPAALAVWRHIGVVAETTHDLVAQREAQTTVRALVLLVGPADPAAAPSDDAGPRHLIATLARKGR